MFYASGVLSKSMNTQWNSLRKKKAYVCDLTAQEMREYRGTLTVQTLKVLIVIAALRKT